MNGGRTTTFALGLRRRIRARFGVPLYGDEPMTDTEESPLDAVPICLPDWRHKFGLEAQVPPPLSPMRTETCHICGRRTTAGLYLLRGTGEMVKPPSSAMPADRPDDSQRYWGD